MARRPLSGRALSAIALCTAIAAQTPATPKAPPIVTIGHTDLDVHTEAISRELFSACDRDSDDRLDLFEACEALETLGDPKESRSFLELDRNRDGFLQWPEFDAHYRSSIERAGRFQVRTCRQFVRQSPELQQAKTATPLEIFLQLNDANENGGLDPEEISKIVRDIGLAPTVEAHLKTLDADRSGLIESSELAPWFEQIRTVVTLPDVSEPTSSALPAPWGDIDTDGDTSIDLAELTAALRRLDPGLQRWAGAILETVDKDGDKKLGGDELPARVNDAGSNSGAGGSDAKPESIGLLRKLPGKRN